MCVSACTHVYMYRYTCVCKYMCNYRYVTMPTPHLCGFWGIWESALTTEPSYQILLLIFRYDRIHKTLEIKYTEPLTCSSV